jgi:magnesium transporter
MTMFKIYQITDGGAQKVEHIVPGSWVHASHPSDAELSQLQEIGIPPELLVHVLDFNERSRVIKRDDVVYLVIHLPYKQQDEPEIPYATAPLSVFLLPEHVITIEPKTVDLIEKISANRPSGLTPHDQTRFVLDLILQAASDYLSYLREINISVDEAEDHLTRSLRNREVLLLLNYQKSLVYFSTSLNSIEMMLEKLRKGDFLQWSSEDQELAEDALIEIRQAVYHVDIAQNILTQMMDAFASIVSNNLNTVMKFLAAVTIIISVPTLIASIYGMNVPLPGESGMQTFGYLLGLSVLLSILVIIIFIRLDWL